MFTFPITLILIAWLLMSLKIEEVKIEGNYDYFNSISSIFISCGLTILGFFLVVFIYLFTVVRPNIFEKGNSRKEDARFNVSHKIASFIYPFGFISFLMIAFPVFILSILMIFNGIGHFSFAVINISILAYIGFIWYFQKSTNKISPYWKMHKQAYHKIFVYYIRPIQV